MHRFSRLFSPEEVAQCHMEMWPARCEVKRCFRFDIISQQCSDANANMTPLNEKRDDGCTWHTTV